MMTALIFITILVALVLVHEFGHFIVAKAFGIQVDEFSIFFPPRLFSKKWGGTTYTLGALPFGGFVKIFGEDGGEETAKDIPSGRVFNPKNFSHRSKWVQAAVIVAGVVFNILFAWLILSAGYMIGMQSSVEHIGVGEVQNAHATILSVVPGSPAEKAGLLANDIIAGIDTGSASLPATATADEVQTFIAAHQDESLVLNVKRGEEELHILTKAQDGILEGHKAIGVQLDDIGILKLSPPLALVQGAVLTQYITVATAQGLGEFFYTIVRGVANLAGVAGPIGIATIASSAVHQGVGEAIVFVALISVNLAIINLVPIPGLDGGRLLFIIIEGLRGKPISEKVALRVTIAGMALLIALMLVISFHDVAKLIGV